MAFVMWDVTSLTSARSTTDEAYGFYFGTKNGVAGYWVRIPDNAPPIGDITLAGVVGSDPVGLSFVVWSMAAGGAVFRPRPCCAVILLCRLSAAQRMDVDGKLLDRGLVETARPGRHDALARLRHLRLDGFDGIAE